MVNTVVLYEFGSVNWEITNFRLIIIENFDSIHPFVIFCEFCMLKFVLFAFLYCSK